MSEVKLNYKVGDKIVSLRRFTTGLDIVIPKFSKGVIVKSRVFARYPDYDIEFPQGIACNCEEKLILEEVYNSPLYKALNEQEVE